MAGLLKRQGLLRVGRLRLGGHLSIVALVPEDYDGDLMTRGCAWSPRRIQSIHLVLYSSQHRFKSNVTLVRRFRVM
ncbi:hypothetical protein FRC16_002661 [Serendipita sp. 398]|nr:hypothetical protein FRC16_002661 [Serendipita sp. 398]